MAIHQIDFVFTDEDETTRVSRDCLRDALHMLDLPPRWTEHRASDAGLPPYAAGQPTPAVFVDGRVVHAAGAPLSRAKVFVALQEGIARR